MGKCGVLMAVNELGWRLGSVGIDRKVMQGQTNDAPYPRHGSGRPETGGIGPCHRETVPASRCHFEKAAPPSAKTELGAFTRIGLTTGALEQAPVIMGAVSPPTPPLASCSSTSDCRDTESRKSTIFALSAAHSSWVMQRLPSPRQFSLPPHWVASIGSSTETMMSATVISAALRPRL